MRPSSALISAAAAIFVSIVCPGGSAPAFAAQEAVRIPDERLRERLRERHDDDDGGQPAEPASFLLDESYIELPDLLINRVELAQQSGMIEDCAEPGPPAGNVVAGYVLPFPSWQEPGSEQDSPPGYSLQQVEGYISADVQAHLDRLVAGGLYGLREALVSPVQFSSEQPGSPWFDYSPEAMAPAHTRLLAHYVRRIDLTAGSCKLPEDWQFAIDAGQALDLWAECALPTDSAGVPVGKPLKYLRPLALRTLGGLYLCSESEQPNRYDITPGMGYSTLFKLYRIDFAGCSDPWLAYDTAEGLLSSSLKRSFGAEPLLAEPHPEGSFGPDSLRLWRDLEESIVLRGLTGPFYEASVYNLRWWEERLGEPGGAQTPLLRLGAENVLTVCYASGSNKRGNYKEPTDKQAQLYGEAVREACRLALESVLAKLEANGITGAEIVED